MTLELPEQLESILATRATQRGMTPEAFTVMLLGRLLVPPEPRDEWERRVFAIGTNCGVSPPNEALSSEALYD